ncbi:amino acid ABC transporter substrate-binding protein [Nocardioides albidus]|uniref:Amino acid ABC transporter substrate-binding protein n=1 Tax=Nocardioides albidus TaxID=1517589 RepID=A0A5C4W129_9ACTN|nr:ABC transporter substrate-binding protein [Nocardioides albidus]TNM41195.1 amino acid ABC transporter substrate-binding protein [Nocardioides albidus]
MRSTRSLALAAALPALLALSACSSGAPEASGAESSDCEVYGEKGSIDIAPAAKGELTVQTNLPSPGWWKGTTPESIAGGFEYCLAVNVAHRAGIDKVRVENVSFDALVAGQTKDYDMAMAQISVTPERQEVVQFSEPYFDSDIGVLAKADSDISADNIQSKTLGVLVGTTAVAYVKDTIKPSGDVKTFRDQNAMITAVRSGAIDAAIQDTSIVLAFAGGSNGDLEVKGQYSSGEHYAAIYPHGSKNAAAIDSALADMREDGTLDKLSGTWLGPELGGDPNAVARWDEN